MKRILILLLIACVIVGFGAAAYFYFQVRRGGDILTLYGNVDVRQVDISFRVAGQVEEMLFEEGDLVEEGKLMARLDETPYTSRVGETKANAKAIAENLANAEILLKRREELIDSGGISRENLDDARARKIVLEAEYASAKSSLEIAEYDLAYTKAFAPTEGIVLTRIREPGAVVNPGVPVYTLSITSPVWVRAYVGEPELGKIYFGMEAEIHTDTKGAPVYKGRIGFISPVAEFTPRTVQTEQLRTDLVYRLRIVVDNPDKLLKQGMPVTVKLNTSWVGSAR
ncbi:MAG: efflux RND transporter periplasmic adaptor subunit [Chlamydiales bacterium]|nr:efflux RND transporter periplasmic adaptor subunit [Chlamydiales bacterium]